VVGHTSSLLYEALSLGCRVFRFESDVPGLELPASCTFRTLEQLEARQVLPQPSGLSTEFFCATGKEALKRYSAFFKEVFPDLYDSRLVEEN